MLLFIMIRPRPRPQGVKQLGGEVVIIAVPLMVITLRNQLKFRRQSPDSPRFAPRCDRQASNPFTTRADACW